MTALLHLVNVMASGHLPHFPQLQLLHYFLVPTTKPTAGVQPNAVAKNRTSIAGFCELWLPPLTSAAGCSHSGLEFQVELNVLLEELGSL
jgi:hypothetical protein